MPALPTLDLFKLNTNQVSLGRPGYTDLSRMHAVGSFNLKNWVVTREEKLREKRDAPSLLSLCKPELKLALRKGIPSLQRQYTWPRLVCEKSEKKYCFDLPSYQEVLYEVFYGKIPRECSKEVSVPDFGGTLLFHSHPITRSGREQVKQMLCVLKHHHEDSISYCPLLPDLCAVLFHYIPDEVVFRMMNAMVERAKLDGWHFTLTGMDFRLEVINFLSILPSFLPHISRHLKRLGFSLEDTIKVWVGRFYVSFLAYDTVLRIIDIYLNEGSKTLFRVALSVLKIHELDLTRQVTAADFEAALARNMCINTDANLLLNTAFSFKLPRSRLKAPREQIELGQIPVARVQVFHVPKMITPPRFNYSPLMSTEQCRCLWTSLPPLLKITDPTFKFGTYKDGFRLAAAARVMVKEKERRRPFILLIKDDNEKLFGAVLDWRSGNLAGSDTSLFMFSPFSLYKQRPRKRKASGINLPPPLEQKELIPRDFLTVGSPVGSPGGRLRRLYPMQKTKLTISASEMSRRIALLNNKETAYKSADPISTTPIRQEPSEIPISPIHHLSSSQRGFDIEEFKSFSHNPMSRPTKSRGWFGNMWWDSAKFTGKSERKGLAKECQSRLAQSTSYKSFSMIKRKNVSQSIKVDKKQHVNGFRDIVREVTGENYIEESENQDFRKVGQL
ncbi:hypothetical protein AAMO2058_000383200 [Amorphochlora amoebiformis]